MSPIKAKEVIKELALELSEDSQEYILIHEYYWKGIREAMMIPQTPSIYVTGLGTFELQPRKVEKKYKELLNKMMFWKKKKVDNAISNQYEKEYLVIKKVYDQINKIKEDQQKFKSNK